jgi:hypothetical protein
MGWDGMGETDLEHIFCTLGLGAVDCEGVVFVVDGAPIVDGRLERGFDFPVLDEVLHEFGERAGFVILLFCCWTLVRER